MRINRTFITMFFLIIFCFGFVSANDFVSHTMKAAEAVKNKDFKTAMKHYDSLLEIVPYYPTLHVRRARAHVELGETERALVSLNFALDLGSRIDPEKDDILRKLMKHSSFSEIKKKMEAIRKPVLNSTRAFTVAEPELIPEGITHDPVENCFYLGGMYRNKIVKIDRNGKKTDFTKEKQDGLRTVLGMKVDPKKRILIAASIVSEPVKKGIDPKESGWSGLFLYNLETGKLIKKYEIFEKGKPHLLNDLVFTSGGDIFITDTMANAIYTTGLDRDKLELFLENENFIYPNGIALSPDEKTLYIATLGGIIMVNINRRDWTYLRHPEKMTAFGIDGLYFYKNSLVAVQNGYIQISRFFLSKKLDSIEKLEILEINNPMLNVPTTGVIVGDEFFYIANVAFGAFNQDGTADHRKLKDIEILKIKLD